MSDRARPRAASGFDRSTARIREEREEDHGAIREVLIEAFGQPDEADLVEALRQGCDDLVSLVAIEADRIVGHILFSPAIIETMDGCAEGMGLAPMAVRPERQRQGLGQRLVGRASRS